MRDVLTPTEWKVLALLVVGLLGMWLFRPPW